MLYPMSTLEHILFFLVGFTLPLRHVVRVVLLLLTYDYVMTLYPDLPSTVFMTVQSLWTTHAFVAVQLSFALALASLATLLAVNVWIDVRREWRLYRGDGDHHDDEGGA
jgi:hypothetical protein